MKLVFSVILAVLVGMSVMAWRMVPPPTAKGKTRLTWATDNNPVRQAQVDLFNKLNPDLELVVDPDNTGQEKVIVQSMGGVGPDLFDSYGALTLRAYVSSGIAFDVTDVLSKDGIDVKKEIWPVALPNCVVDDRVYGFPANVNAHAIWFNKDIFDAENLPYPKSGWTWEECIGLAQKLTKYEGRRPVRFGLMFGFGDWQNLLLSFGGRIFDETGTRCSMDTPEAQGAIQLAHDLMYKYKVTPNPVQESTLATQGGWGSGGMTLLLGGKVAMSFGGRYWLNLMRTDKECPRLGVVEIPYAKEETLVGGARCTLVNARGPNRTAALRFLKFLAGREYNELLNRQADALAPVKKYCYTPEFLVNPEHPEEDYNAVWRAAVEKSTPEGVSMFARGAELAPMNAQLDLIKANLKPVPAALKLAASETNERIRRNARIRPYLGRLFTELTGEKP